jgi:hypothetical protein
MAVKKRPQGPQEPNLRIQTNPVDTYARPAPPAERADLVHLAQSLGGVSEQLAAYARAYTRNQAESGASEAFGLRLRNTNREVSRMLSTPGGVPPAANRAALEMGHGEDLARSDWEDIRRRYLGESTAPAGQPSNAFDRNSGNLDEWFKQLMGERESQLPAAEGTRFGWRRMMQGFQERLYAEHDNYLVQRTTQANLDRAHQDFYGIASDAVAAGERDPSVIHQRMLGATGRAGQVYRLTPAQTNAAMFSAARSIAEQGIPGNPDLAVQVVREMLLGPRTGADGRSMPPLGNSEQYAHLTNQVIEAAQKRAGELQRTLNLETIVQFRELAGNGQLDEEAAKKFFGDNPHVLGPSTQAHLESILLQNRTAIDKAREAQQRLADDLARRATAQASEDELNLFLQERGDAGTLNTIPERMSVTKPNGEPKEIQRQELVDRARDNELARIAEWARQQGQAELDDAMSPPVANRPSIQQRVFDREFAFFDRNGLVHPGWRDTLAGGYATATPAAIAGNAPPPILTEAVQLYETLEARAPGMLERHLQSQAARDFYRVYRIGRTVARMDERQALTFAATSSSDIGGDESRAPAFKKVEEELGRSRSIFPWVEGITNFGDMREDISRMSRALVRAGMTPEAAVRAAGEDVRQLYTNINGFMVRTGDANLEAFGPMLRAAGLQPTTFADSVKKYLDAYAKENPAAADSFRVDPVATGDAGDPYMAARRQLSIRPITGGTGTWAVIDATTGLPVPSAGMRQVVSMRDLLEHERRTQTEAQTREAARLAQAARDNPPAPPQPPPGTTRALPHTRSRPPIRIPRTTGGWPEDAPEQ